MGSSILFHDVVVVLDLEAKFVFGLVLPALKTALAAWNRRFWLHINEVIGQAKTGDILKRARRIVQNCL